VWGGEQHLSVRPSRLLWPWTWWRARLSIYYMQDMGRGQILTTLGKGGCGHRRHFLWIPSPNAQLSASTAGNGEAQICLTLLETPALLSRRIPIHGPTTVISRRPTPR
jgi:hypothetical protein